MLGLIISLALAALVVITSVGAIRRGAIEIGERTYDRKQPVFWLTTLGGVVGGTLVMMFSIWSYTEVQAESAAAPRVMERDGVRVTFPASWEPLPELEKSLGTGGPRSLAVGGDGAELLIMWPAARPAANAGHNDLRAVAEDMKNPALSYEHWSVSESGDAVLVDASYPSPRGHVLSRHIIFEGADHAVHVVIGTCSTEGDIAGCRDVIGSLVRSEAEAGEVESGPKPVLVAAGGDRACVVTDAGVLSCWVAGGAPTRVAGLELVGAKQLVGASDRTCVLDAQGSVTCVRHHDVDAGPTFAKVPGWEKMTQIALGPGRLCGVDANERLRCDTNVPEPVRDMSTVHSVALGRAHSCALSKRGKVMCWGETEQQQLGENVEEGVSAFSVRGIQALVAVGNLSCALLATKQPWCWGNGEASLSRVNGIDDAHELAAGGGGVCARIGSGAVACWGERSWLGGHAHVPVPKITNATAIAVGREQVCAITEDLGRSRLYCWKPGEPPREISGY